MIFRKIRNLVAKIPKGKVTTYGEIAKALGIKDARVVGWAIYGNTDPKIPCHRVVMRDGFLAKNYSLGGAKIQKEKLKKEGVKFIGKFQVDLKSHFWKPKMLK
ncbi:MAG: MGMT family protein [Microgenomates group bacterium]